MSKAVVTSSIVFELLDEHNYVDWSEAIEAYLKAQDLWDVVKSDQQPPKIEEDEAQFKAWEKKNAAALHAIKISCGTNVLQKIRGIGEAKIAWVLLRNWLNDSLLNAPQSNSNKIQIFEDLLDIEGSIADEENVNRKKRTLQIAVSREKRTLEIALREGDIEIAKPLVEKDPQLLFFPDTLGLTPLAAAIGSDMNPNKMANMLYSLTPNGFWTNCYSSMNVITKCFEVGNLDFLLKLLKFHPEEFILAKDYNGNSSLCAAARAPHLFRHSYHHPFLPKYICQFLGPRLPLGSINFEISGIKFLIHLGNAIRDPTHCQEKIDIVSDAFFEAIKHGNFNFILMLINSIKRIVHLTDDDSRNMYMFAIAHRHPKLFSLYFWDKRDQGDLDPSLSLDKCDNNLLHMVGASTPPIAIDRISKPALQMKRELMWFKEIEKLVPDIIKKSRNQDGKTPHELFNESHRDLMMEAGKWMKESASSWAIVGPLIITIMFAAAFQVPGGINQEKGFPIFINKRLFKVYMVLVAISLFSATISVLKFLEILSANYEEKNFLASLRTYNVITGTLFLSLATMLVAFCMGLFLTLHGELAMFLPIAAIATFLVGYIICTKLPLLAESLSFFIFEEVKIPFIKWSTSIFDRNIGPEVKLIFEMLNDSQQAR